LKAKPLLLSDHPDQHQMAGTDAGLAAFIIIHHKWTEWHVRMWKFYRPFDTNSHCFAGESLSIIK